MNTLAEIDRERARLESRARARRFRDIAIGIFMLILVVGTFVAMVLFAAWVRGWTP